MPKIKENQLYLTIKVDKQFKYELKGQAAKEMTTMQDLIIKVLKDYCRKREEDKEWNNFIKAHDNAPEEDPTPGDIEAIERGRREIEAGEVQDFEDAIKEIENED
jgi:hypothetical protein